MISTMSIPNILSISRIPLGLLLIIFYNPTNKISLSFSIGIILLALLTDFADGKLARYLKSTNIHGYMLDGIGDKAFYVAFLIVILREHGNVGVLCWFLIVREIVMYALRAVSDTLSSQLIKLRIYSLSHALWLRLCFLCVIVHDVINLNGNSVPSLLFGAVFCSLIACISGYISIFFQIKGILVEK